MTRVHSALVGASLLAALGACSKEALPVLTQPATGAYVKFYNDGIGSPGVNFYANETKVTAVSSTSCTPPTDPRCTAGGIETLTGTTYGNVADGGLYSSIDPGTYTFSARIATATDNGVVSSSLSSAVEAGKYYSMFQTGFYNTTTKKADAFIVADALPPDFDYTHSLVRFVNASPNAQPMTLWAKNTVTGDSVAIGTNVAYKSAGAFVTIPSTSYDLTVRYAGSNTAVIVLAAQPFAQERVYTVSARGDMTVTSTTAATRPLLDVVTNR